MILIYDIRRLLIFFSHDILDPMTVAPILEPDENTFEVVPYVAADVPYSQPRGYEFIGNRIILREEYIQYGARKSWINNDLPLVSGWLREILFYTRPFSEQPDVSSLRLQIWRTVGDSNSLQYRLQFEYKSTDLDLISADGKAWRVSCY